MDHCPNFDPRKEYSEEYKCRIPSGCSKSLELLTFRNAIETIWNEKLRNVIPVDFRASVKETYTINNEVMTVLVVYKPLI